MTDKDLALARQDKLFTFVMALCAVLVLAIPVGIANMFLGFVMGESPCTLCWWERMGMVTFGVISLLIVRYGPKLKYIGFMLAIAAYGLFMTLRHTMMCASTSEMGYGFGTAILGAHTYTWGVFVYWMVGLVMGFILMYFSRDPKFCELLKGKCDKNLGGFSKFAFGICFIVICSNAFQAFFQNGIPPFSGQSSPTRFTMDFSTAPERWTTTVWARLTKGFNLTGDWKIDDSYIVGETTPKKFKFNLKSSDGAFEELKPAPKLISEKPLNFEATGFKNEGVAAGLTFVADTGEWAIASTKGGVYYVDESFEKITRRGIIDLVNGSDMPYAVDIAWINNMAITAGRNKIIWASAPMPEGKKMDPFVQWSIFTETTGNIATPWDRKRKSVRTIRSKMNWIGSISAGVDSNSFYMTTLPSDKSANTILIKIDASDFLLSAETPIKVASNLKLKDSRNLDDYYILGLAQYNGKLLAFSRQYSTLLTIDPLTGLVVDAHAMPAMDNLHSMAIKGDELVMLDRRENKNYVVKFDLKTL